MNEIMAEYILDGLAGLQKLMAGKHLRPAQLASTIVSVVATPEAAADIVLGYGQKVIWEAPNGEEDVQEVS